MGLFSNLMRRSKGEEVTNPCPIDTQDTNSSTSMSLSNLLKQLNGNAMNLSPFFCGVNIISNSIALMKWLYKDEDDNLLPTTNYLYHMFDDSKLTRFNMIKNVIIDIILHGNGFIYIERDKETGQPKTLHYSPAEQTLIYWNPIKYDMYFNNPYFSSRWDDGTNYLHFFMISEDGFNGTPIRDYAYKAIKLSDNTEKSALDYYSSGGQLYGLITTNGSTPMVGTMEKQIKTLRQSWDEARSQSQGTGTIFIPADLKFQQLSSSAKDSAMVESREYNITEIARFLNISPLLLGDLRHNVYGNLAEAQKELIIHTLAPYVTMMEEEATRKLIMPSKRGKYFIDLDENSILATDQEKQANYYNTLVGGGIMAVNEARHRLGLPAVDGGDRLIIPYTSIEDNTIGDTEQNK